MIELQRAGQVRDQGGTVDRCHPGAVTLSIPVRLRRYGGQKQVVMRRSISAALNAVAAPTALQVALVRSHRWLRMIERARVANITAIAKAENVDRSYISRMINLKSPAPEIQAAILEETRPCRTRCRCSTWPATRRCRGSSSRGGLKTRCSAADCCSHDVATAVALRVFFLAIRAAANCHLQPVTQCSVMLGIARICPG